MTRRTNAFPFSELVKLGLESQAVIALRWAKTLQGGPSATAELTRMLTEKVAAFGETSAMLFWGAPPKKIIRRYRRYVKLNKRRLGRG